MSNVFRIYDGGDSTLADWQSSPLFPYNSTNRNTIQDPNGAKATSEITSIPSPFARMDLVKAAFQEVVKSKDLRGDTIFHKMVSDTLDVMEIFFNNRKFADIVEIIKWDVNSDLADLINSANVGNKCYGETLQTYLQSDAATYNFGQMNAMYLLNYKKGPDELNIIGATSPATLFFCNANDLTYVEDIHFGTDVPFDSDFRALADRDTELIKYLFLLRKTNPNFADLFPEVDDYLTLTYSDLGVNTSDEKNKKSVQRINEENQLKSEIGALTVADLANYDPLNTTSAQTTDIVEVAGIQLYEKSGKFNGSEFAIKPNPNLCAGQQPLVLPIKAGNTYRDLKYTTDSWGDINKAPNVAPQADLSERVLPYDGTQYPYITISDLLEDSIIKVDYALNERSYFNGNNSDSNNTFLLPVKPLFFNYFTVVDLMGTMIDGRNMIEMTPLVGGSVKVTLRIPITGNSKTHYIEYERTYYDGRTPEPEMNEGGVTKCNFTGFIMPVVRFNNPAEAIYNVGCVKGKSSKLCYKFLVGANVVDADSVKCRIEDLQNTEANVISYDYRLAGKNFDAVQVEIDGRHSLLIPRFKSQGGPDNYEFAIDLGTSNTHIEYRKGTNGIPQPFTFTQKEEMVCHFFLPRISNQLVEHLRLIIKDYIPDSIGGQNDNFGFPTRTVLSCGKNVNWTDLIEPFSEINLPFTYDKLRSLPHNKYHDNIKWGTDQDLLKLQVYVKTLALMIRNKVLLNGGNLAGTRITWFYPISMSGFRLASLKQTWDHTYQAYFNPTGCTTAVSESEAPVYHYFKSNALAAKLVCVDIGGGTSDVAFASNGQIDYISSFRFAANTLFEDPYASGNIRNGIVDCFKDIIRGVLKQRDGVREVLDIFDDECNLRPSNMASFLFSLKSNRIILDQKINTTAIDFNLLLSQSQDFKIVFILFYSAIIYHVANTLKQLNIDLPRQFAFSGNGSKLLPIITGDIAGLAKFTKVIIEKVTGRKYGPCDSFTIVGLGDGMNPKEATCKGGLQTTSPVPDAAERIRIISADGESVLSPAMTYEKVTNEYKEKCLDAVREFFRFIFEDVPSEFNYNKQFGVSSNSLGLAKRVCMMNLDTYLDHGIEQRLQEAQPADPIEETFFFYPIRGAINALSAEIATSLSSNGNKLTV